MTDLHFFGCASEAGHRLHGRLRSRYSLPPELRDRIDNGTTQSGLKDRYGNVVRDDQVEGHARLNTIAGWTVLVWWDRTGDNRFGSHSNLLAPGTWTAEQLLEAGRLRFPWLFERITYKIVVTP